MAQIKLDIAKEPKIFEDLQLTYKDIDKQWVVQHEGQDIYHIKTYCGKRFVLEGKLKEYKGCNSLNK